VITETADDFRMQFINLAREAMEMAGEPAVLKVFENA
jgi:hypothetical protein